MSTNSLPPFGDVVVVKPGGSLQDCFEWDEIQRKIIYEHREYHLAMIHFLDDLARNGPGGSDRPRRPKGDLASILNQLVIFKINILLPMILHLLIANILIV